MKKLFCLIGLHHWHYTATLCICETCEKTVSAYEGGWY